METSIRTPTATSIRLPGRTRLHSSSGTRSGETIGADLPNYSEDLNIFKVFPMADQRKLRFEASIEISSTACFSVLLTTNWSSTAFGSVNTQCNQPRSVQFALRFDFKPAGFAPPDPPSPSLAGTPRLRSRGRAFARFAHVVATSATLAPSHTTV